MTTPSITPAQVVAIVKAALALAVSFGLSVSGQQTAAILAVVALIVPAVFLLVADAHLRTARAANAVEIDKAKLANGQ